MIEQKHCLDCGALLVEESTRWRCHGCGRGGGYLFMQFHSRRIRVRAVEFGPTRAEQPSTEARA